MLPDVLEEEGMCGVYTHVDIERMVAVLRSTNALRVLMALKMEPKLSGSQWDQCLSGSKGVAKD